MHAMWICPAYKKGIGGGKEWEKEKKGREKKGEEGRSNSFFLLFPAFRRSEVVELRVKVRLLDEGYTPRGRDFPTLVDFLPFWTSFQRDGLRTVILD